MIPFILQAVELESVGREDDAIDIIYEQMNDLMWARNFRLIDQNVLTIDPSFLGVHVILAILVTTSWARREFHNRANFYQKAEDYLKTTEHWSKFLLVGLQ